MALKHQMGVRAQNRINGPTNLFPWLTVPNGPPTRWGYWTKLKMLKAEALRAIPAPSTVAGFGHTHEPTMGLFTMLPLV